MAKTKTVYKCVKCGSAHPKWQGQCSNCKEWNTLEESSEVVSKGKAGAVRIGTKTSAVKLNSVFQQENDRYITGINEFDRVMGGGIIKDSMTIVAGSPGSGKSSILASICHILGEQGNKVLYASGEESESQIKARATRIVGEISDNMWVISTTCMDDILNAVYEIDADIVVIDSIQCVALNEFLPSRAGNPTQVLECTDALLKIAKNDRKRAVIMISQLNKEDEIAGLRSLEHTVDTVLTIQAENSEELRTMLTTKNRFGSIGEMGFFKMTERGLLSVDNPSEFFTVERNDGEEISGCALTVVREGTRPIVLEIQSLVSTSYTSFPSRITESFSRDSLNTLISIIEQRASINLNDKNVVVKSMGSSRLKDSGANLSVCLSVISALLKAPIPLDIAFIGDVGLTGEIKKVPATELRIRELARMGFTKVYVARNSLPSGVTIDGIEVRQVRTILEVKNEIFGVGARR